MRVYARSVLLLAAVFPPFFARATVIMPKVFSDHMVIQRHQPIHLWGKADPGEKVTVEFGERHASVNTDGIGRWSVYLPLMEAGGPYILTVSGQNVVRFSDVLLGDVWVASGQSNMQMPLGGFPQQSSVKDAEMEINQADFPTIRFMRIGQYSSMYPLEDVRSATLWQICNPDTARDLSAVAYFFGRDLQKVEKVPIGLIVSTWNGTPAAPWVSLDALSADSSLMPVFAARAGEMDGEETANDRDAADKISISQGRTVPKRGGHGPSDFWQPAGLFNGMIAPLTPMAIRGVIWYQGESDAIPPKAPIYQRLFSTLINDWRNQWNVGNFPFLYVQLAGFGNAWDEGWNVIRDAQRRTLGLANTGMAVALDSGEEKNIHPANKQIIGERLSLLARALAYGEAVQSSGPLFREAVPMDGGIRVWFDHAEGLHALGAVEEFEVAGADKVFFPATAIVDGETVFVRSDKCREPLFVRYGWKGFPANPNLYNGAGLPTATFTSLHNGTLR
jgi:sialate O-acetylesterase